MVGKLANRVFCLHVIQVLIGLRPAGPLAAPAKMQHALTALRTEVDAEQPGVISVLRGIRLLQSFLLVGCRWATNAFCSFGKRRVWRDIGNTNLAQAGPA